MIKHVMNHILVCDKCGTEQDVQTYRINGQAIELCCKHANEVDNMLKFLHGVVALGITMRAGNDKDTRYISADKYVRDYLKINMVQNG